MNTSPRVSTKPSPGCEGNSGRAPVRFGIVGAGAVAQAYLQAFAGCVEAKVVGVADVRPEARHATAAKAGCTAYDSAWEMAEHEQLDAAIVATPPVTHAEISIDLLRRGIHVLCEKPLTLNMPDAFRMFDTARKHGAKLAMASKFRSVDDVVRAKQMIAAGVLGDLILCENVFASRVDMSGRWNSRPEISGGGVLIDNGTHSVDIMHCFLGRLNDMYVFEGKRSQGLAVEDTVSMIVRSENGVIGNIDLSWSITKERPSFLDIYGSNGAISIGWKESRHLDYGTKQWTVFGSGYDKIRAFHQQIDNFSLAIRGERPLLITEEDALASVNVIQLAYQALRQNPWPPLSIPYHPAAFEEEEIESPTAV